MTVWMHTNPELAWPSWSIPFGVSLAGRREKGIGLQTARSEVGMQFPETVANAGTLH